MNAEATFQSASKRGPVGLSQDLVVDPWGSTLLLVEDDLADADRIRVMLQEPPADQFHVTHVESLTRARQALAGQDFSVILLDLSLPDARGLVPIESLLSVAPEVPVVVLSGVSDQKLAVQAVQAGAQDFLMKRRVNSRALIQSLRYAIERKRAESRLAHLAHFDQLTGLANRSLFQRRLDQALTRAELSSEKVALLYIDLDRFRQVNERCGPDGGDSVLQEVARRLQVCVRDHETVARLEGDEFCVVLEGVRKVEDGEVVAERIVKALKEPLGALSHGLQANIGVAISGEDGSVEALLERADQARCRAKAEGRSRVASIFTSVRQQGGDACRAIEAMERDEFSLVFQPRLDLDHYRVSAVEAFLRWDDPARGWLRPHEFMPAIKEANQMVPIAEWAVREAARYAKQWRQDGLPALRMVVNLAEAQFIMPDPAARLVEIVKEMGAEPSWFELDCAEKILMDNPARSRSLLQAFRAAGFRTAIDDFGTGFGHLAELTHLPLDVLKIDRSIIDTVDEVPARRALVAAAVGIGRELALEVVAEGVERDSQMEALRAIGTKTVQGYWFAEPKNATAFADWWACRGATG